MISQPIDWTGVRELRERSKNDRRKDGTLVFQMTDGPMPVTVYASSEDEAKRIWADRMEGTKK